MRRDAVVTKRLESSFLSCDKDMEQILKLLFVESAPYSNYLKRLLIINERDCLEDKQEYKDLVSNLGLGRLIEEGYIHFNESRLKFSEHQDLKAYLIINFRQFTPNRDNPKFRNCTVEFDIVCNRDSTVLNNYKHRGYAIAGYIDGILNLVNERALNTSSGKMLSGMGNYVFSGCDEESLDEHLTLICLTYRATHFVEDAGEVPANK